MKNEGILSYQQLEDCALQMDKIAYDIKSIIEAFTEEIKTIEKNGYWKGNAADYFQNQFVREKPKLIESYSQLFNYSRQLKLAVARYNKLSSVISGVGVK